MENLDPPPPPPPQIKDGKMARFCPSSGFILDLGGWGFAVPFYFVQDCSPEEGLINIYLFKRPLSSNLWLELFASIFSVRNLDHCKPD